MVIILESRLERRRRRKKEKRLAFLRALVILSTLALLYFGIKLVNNEIIYLGYVDNPTIFALDLKERKLQLFGKKYLIDLKILKESLDERP